MSGWPALHRVPDWYAWTHEIFQRTENSLLITFHCGLHCFHKFWALAQANIFKPDLHDLFPAQLGKEPEVVLIYRMHGETHQDPCLFCEIWLTQSITITSDFICSRLVPCLSSPNPSSSGDWLDISNAPWKAVIMNSWDGGLQRIENLSDQMICLTFKVMRVCAHVAKLCIF